MKLLSKACVLAGISLAFAQAQISFSPVTSGATESAQKLYNFLATNYGVKTVSGMMTGEVNTSSVQTLLDVDAFYTRTGKYPALVGFDFLFATGVKASEGWYQTYTENIIEAAKELWSLGGIPAFTWHWKDPSDQIDAFYTKSGNKTNYTEFDFTQGFTDPNCTSNCSWNTTSTTYQQIVSDIDEIADYFLQLQNAGAAAVFRPVHEASGAWFWWGDKGGAAFQALYNLIYDEMVNVKGVKNLVWVWNPEYATDTDWNPGTAKYDIVSLDIYEAWNYSTKYILAYNTLSQNFPGKILAISENGPIPDMSVMAENNIKWSWWMPWYQTWDGNFLDQTVDPVWKANVESPCTITLEDMPGWNSYSISQSTVAACEVGYKLADLDTARPVAADIFPGDTATNGWLRVKFNAGLEDTANGNVVIKQGAIDLSSESQITLTAYNTNAQSGIWFTIAFLGNESTDWAWAQPDGCWINPGDSTVCEINLATTAKGTQVLTGNDYTTFMKNISKVYIEIFQVGYSGQIFFDNVKAGSTTINDFENTAQKISTEESHNLVVAEIIGKGKSAAIQQHTASAFRMELHGKNLSVALPIPGMASIDLFDLNGNLVKTLHRGNLSAGIHTTSLEGIRHGNYILRAKGAFGVSARQIRIH
ncbi:glycosyl hydrolase [uncultured Fibrobacter sp.]|uniref:glycosyl hydrolase n=1 Tax=uncultured Fibrobacter sp. TaxID=261512 RepID=UPI002803EE9A|nr:glycosyl hydrolase [uncultured Fibrobacter sp.]